MSTAKRKIDKSKTKTLREPAGSRPGPPRPSLVLLGAVVAVVVTIVLIAHWPALSAAAVSFDDNEYLIHNPLVKNAGWTTAGRFLTEVLQPSTVHGYYQPLTMISLMLDYAAGGRVGRLMPFHRTSLILHATNTVLVIVLMYLLFSNGWAACMVGLLFGVHPMTVETIPWVGERKTLLAALFALLSLIAYVRYTRSGRWTAWAACLAMYVLALMSKPTSTPLPVCMLLLDYWPLRRLNKHALLEKVPLFAIAAVSGYITYESQHRTASTETLVVEHALRVPYTLCHNIIFYPRKILWPTNLSSHYAFPDPFDLSHPDVLAGVIGTALLMAALVLSLRWTRALLAGWLYFFAAIFPTLGVIGFTIVIAADKFAYLPSVGLMLPLTALVCWLWGQARAPARVARRAGTVAVVAGLTVLAAAGTRRHLAHFKNTETLFRYMHARTPDSPAVSVGLGLELVRQKRLDEAIDLYLRAIEVAAARKTSYHEMTARYNLGVALFQDGQVDAAIRQYEQVLKLNPAFAQAHNNLGYALVRKGDLQRAIFHYQRAIEQQEDYAAAHYNLANALTARGDWVGAVAHYERTLQIDPDHAAAHKNLATALLRQGDFDGAVRHFDQALRLRPDFWPVVSDAAWFCATAGDPTARNPAGAIRLAELACRATDRKQPAALGALAAAYAETGRLDLAQPVAREAIQLALATGQRPLALELQARLRQYQTTRPSHERTEGDNP